MNAREMSTRQIFSAKPTMALLRGFQRRTADYVFDRLYSPSDPALRFLIADEVGLGKTIVARGIVAKTIEHLQGRMDRIDIIYVCSNATIEHQNLRRLIPLMDDAFRAHVKVHSTPLTMLKPSELCASEEQSKAINFLSFTPETSLQLKSRRGKKEERALLFLTLCDSGYSKAALRNLLQGPVHDKHWKTTLELASAPEQLIVEQFNRRLKNNETLRRLLHEQLEKFKRKHDWPPEYKRPRYELIGLLRQELASVCLDQLKPALIIFDEFQRFRDLLTPPEDEELGGIGLTKQLLSYADAAQNRIRTLLLSATPYKMPLQDSDAKGDHYEDLKITLGFLFQHDKNRIGQVMDGLDRYRKALQGVKTEGVGLVMQARDEVQSKLRSVMVRTERIGDTHALNAMVREAPCDVAIDSKDLKIGRLMDRLSMATKTRDAMEYWKSSPYPLSFMSYSKKSEYRIAQEIHAQLRRPPDPLRTSLRDWKQLQPTKKKIAAYAPIDLPNGRMRFLQAATLDAGLGKVLWLPPSLPYYSLAGAWAELQVHTKALVFSRWQLVPNGIAMLLSYEAERRVRQAARESANYKNFSKLGGGLRAFRSKPGEHPEMSQFCLLYPCVWLASAPALDPLTMDVRDVQAVLAKAKEWIEKALIRNGMAVPKSGKGSSNWHWGIMARMDLRKAGTIPASWLTWLRVADEADEDAEFDDHAFESLREHPTSLPPDACDVLALEAIGSPAICALRALHRVAPGMRWDDPILVRAAGEVARAFRSLFNRPEAALLVGSAQSGVPYWKSVLRYCAEGNLQAVLDEYVHTVMDTLGLVGKHDDEIVEAAAKEVSSALSIKAAPLALQQIASAGKGFKVDAHQIRCRFAMRLTDLRDESGTVSRIDQVRQAFNSPFWPMVLATTSVGQEGLDFHPYCHSVWHWNLPTNPVDMEQREGRVHRYKGHAVRRNLAQVYGFNVATAELRKRRMSDPWKALFAVAEDQSVGRSELIPYWVFEGSRASGVAVDRYVLNLPFSREIEQYGYLKRTVALYRLAFGQPRQQDLVAFLLEQIEGLSATAWQIDLSPPRQRRHAEPPVEIVSNPKGTHPEVSRVLNAKYRPLALP